MLASKPEGDGRNEHCAGRDDGKLRCDLNNQVCIECTPETEAQDCGEFSCRFSTKSCTENKVAENGLGFCDVCETDTECNGRDPNRPVLCVPVNYNGSDQGHVCMKKVESTEDCTPPYVVRVEKTSIDGQTHTFCMHNEELTTCYALSTAFQNYQSQSECASEGLSDGLCLAMYAADLDFKFCTYRCSQNSECGGSGDCFHQKDRPSSEKVCCVFGDSCDYQ
ncbi:MAG: hypothetical protein IPJ88_11535 [Myxococcales bacterium]|nr:MAG: hypothetical protein IPJ88_11535 [Myxococcales bacterium]